METRTMTDLENLAEEYAITYGIGDNFNVSDYIKFAVSFAQRETELLSKHLLEMQNTNGALTDRVNELEAQIKNITGLLNDILWKCTCKEYEKATQDLKKLINELEAKE